MIPKYIQIKNKITTDIRSGVLKPGDRLPSRRELQQLYGVTAVTIEKAFQELISSGVLVGYRKRGTVVSRNPVKLKVAVVSDLKYAYVDKANARTFDIQAIFGAMIIKAQKMDIVLEFHDIDAISISSSFISAYDMTVWVQPGNDAFERLLNLDSDLLRKVLVVNRYHEALNYVSTNHKEAFFRASETVLEACDDNCQLFYLDCNQSDFIKTERQQGFLEACKNAQKFYLISSPVKNKDDLLAWFECQNIDPGRQLTVVSPVWDYSLTIFEYVRSNGFTLGDNLFYCDINNPLQASGQMMNFTSIQQDYGLMGEMVIDGVEKAMTGKFQEFVPVEILKS